MSGLIYKSVQFSVYCFSCDEIDDFQEFKNQRQAEKRYREKGWRKTKSGWQCPKCNKK